MPEDWPLPFSEAAPAADMLSYGAASYDQGYDALVSLNSWYASRQASRNEATTRLHLIDRLFFDCLGWRRDDAVTEDRITDSGYTDYTFLLPRPTMIVEAKREGKYFDLPLTSRNEISLRALRRDDKNLAVAIDQVAAYCARKGGEHAVVTNGHQIIAFVAIRIGMDPLDGRAVIYTSLQQMLERFQEFWNYLSRDGLAQRTLISALSTARAPEIPAKLSRRIGDYPGTKNRNAFQADLQAVSELVLEDVTRIRELEPRFLKDCYCENGALSQYSLVSKGILRARYAALFDGNQAAPSLSPIDNETIQKHITAESFSPRPVLLIGDVGVGKTTFIKHLLVEEEQEPDLKEHTIFLYLDLRSSQTMSADFKVAVLEEIRDQLYRDYKIDIEADEFVRGVYHGELLRFSGSIQKRIRDSNPQVYREREVRFLEQKLGQPDRHMRAALQHIVKARKKQVVIILDNCDHRTPEIQEQALVMAEEMAQHWPALVFLTLRPETFHVSRRRGVLTAYHPKAFAISPPRIDEVIYKRLDFALRITSNEIPLGTEYGGMVSARFDNMDVVIRVFLHSLKQNVQLLECIENVSGNNVRLALDMIRDFFGSGHVDTPKIVRKMEESGNYVIPIHEFERTLIYKDSVYFDPIQSPVLNVFDVSSADPKEHFLVLMALGVLRNLSDPMTEKGFVKTNKVYDILQAAGYAPNQIDIAVLRAARHKLLETVARAVPEPGGPQSPAMRITTVGMYHLWRLSRRFTYHDAVVVDTPIFDPEVRARVGDARTVEERVERAELFRAYLDAVWATLSGQEHWFDWALCSKDLKFDIGNARRSAARRAQAS